MSEDFLRPNKETVKRIWAEFGLNERRIKEAVDMIKEWLKSQPHLPDMNGKYSEQKKLSFVRLCYVSLKHISSKIFQLVYVTDKATGFQFIASFHCFQTQCYTRIIYGLWSRDASFFPNAILRH